MLRNMLPSSGCILPLHSSAQAIHPGVWDCVCSSCLANAIGCLVCSSVVHCAWVMENVKLGLETAMLSVVWLSDVVISNAPSEVDLVIVYASGREKCCTNATATVTALGTGYERACLYGKGMGVYSWLVL
jgi:hypothetical protein